MAGTGDGTERLIVRRWARHWIASPAALYLAIAGCHQPGERFKAATIQKSSSFTQSVAGQSVQGRPIDCWNLGNGPDVTLIIATIHGDEPAGTPLVKRLADQLVDQPDLLDGRKLVIVPIANPDGFAACKRANAHGVDLNRNYPASNYDSHPDHGRTALSEPESRALCELIEKQSPSRVISIHQPIRSGIACIDYDGPASELAAAMARACDLPIEKLGGRPGSLGSYVGETQGRPIITVELPASASKWDGEKLWSCYGPMLLAALRCR